MKQSLRMFAILLMLPFLFACGASPSTGAETAWEDKPIVRVTSMVGPTGIGMVRLMEDNENQSSANRYEFTLAAEPSEAVGLISSGSADVAAIPLNVASTLYGKTEGGVRLLAVNTLGAFYVLERGDTVQTVADLSGKTLYATGQGATPEYSLDYILSANGIVDCTVDYKTEHSELATLMASGEVDLAMLPEPFVTTVLNKAQDVRIALRLSDDWANAVVANGGTDGQMVTGCLVARKEFLEQNPEAVATLLEEYAASVQSVNDDAASASQLVVKFGIMADAALAEKAIPNCNIVCITGDAMQAASTTMLSVLHGANAQSVGGAMPDEAFYYKP